MILQCDFTKNGENLKEINQMIFKTIFIIIFLINSKTNKFWKIKEKFLFFINLLNFIFILLNMKWY